MISLLVAYDLIQRHPRVRGKLRYDTLIQMLPQVTPDARTSAALPVAYPKAAVCRPPHWRATRPIRHQALPPPHAWRPLRIRIALPHALRYRRACPGDL